MLKNIGGESRKPLDAEVQKIYMRSVCDNIFSEQFQTKMTWTGKTNNKSVKKIALQNYKRVLELIFELAAAADKTIDSKMGKNLIVYSVLKYAYRNATVETIGTSDHTSHRTTAASINDTSVQRNHDTNTAQIPQANSAAHPPDPMNSYHQHKSYHTNAGNTAQIPLVNPAQNSQANSVAYPPDPMNSYHPHKSDGQIGSYSDASHGYDNYHQYPTTSQQQQQHPIPPLQYPHPQYPTPMMTGPQNVPVRPPQPYYHSL